MRLTTRLIFLTLAAIGGMAAPALAQGAIAPRDIASLESAGTMRDIASGAYERTLWAGNPRSEIIDALQSLPVESALRSLHDMKRRVLLSQSDASLIRNDTPVTADNNIFILRLKKLQEMGLFEDALKLYTDNIDTPRDPRLAETGLILITHQRGLATACLEEKVLAPQFEGDEFFGIIDAICSFELGQTDTPPALAQSKLLESVFSTQDRKFAASDLSRFGALSPLELAILKSEGRIDYTTFDTTPGALRAYPARVLMSFLEDRALPEARREPLQVEMARRGYVSVRRLAASKEARLVGIDVNDLRKRDEKAADALLWKTMLPLLEREPQVVNLTPYGGLMREADPAPLSGAALYKAIGVILASGQDLPPRWCARLGAQDRPEAAIYRQLLIFLNACEEIGDKAVDNLETAMAGFALENHGILWVLMGLYAPKGPEYADFNGIYEKHFPLTPPDDYVMHKDAWTRGPAEIKGFQGFGLPLLRILALDKGNSGDSLSPSALQITAKSLLDEGLESDARQLAREVLVGILLNNKK